MYNLVTDVTEKCYLPDRKKTKEYNKILRQRNLARISPTIIIRWKLIESWHSTNRELINDELDHSHLLIEKTVIYTNFLLNLVVFFP